MDGHAEQGRRAKGRRWLRPLAPMCACWAAPCDRHALCSGRAPRAQHLASSFCICQGITCGVTVARWQLGTPGLQLNGCCGHVLQRQVGFSQTAWVAACRAGRQQPPRLCQHMHLCLERARPPTRARARARPRARARTPPSHGQRQRGAAEPTGAGLETHTVARPQRAPKRSPSTALRCRCSPVACQLACVVAPSVAAELYIEQYNVHVHCIQHGISL